MGIVLGWLLFSLVPAAIASSNNRSGVKWYFLSLLISPLIALIALIAIGNKEDPADRQVPTSLAKKQIDESDGQLSKLERLQKLRGQGALTEEEFRKQKEKVLAEE